ncbi:hypothetical protein [Microvirga pakistanensis]|uniref:hypothetical protein n=1 Tax=Microvirga pakistanensis TaxID=1682650 RepID=UPI00106AD1B3|nr:hypothetical protein [Microvirga pakistanensis]
MGDNDFIRKSLFMTGGLLVWAVQFTLVYVFNSLACARRFAGMELMGIGIVPFVVTGITLAALLATALVFFLALRRRGPAYDSRDDKPVNDFMRYTTMTIAGLSFVAIVWNGIPALLVPPCG